MRDTATRLQLALATLGTALALAAGVVPAAIELLGEEQAPAPQVTPVTAPVQAQQTTTLDPTTPPRQTGDGERRDRKSR